MHDQSRVAAVEGDGCRKRQRHRALDRPHADRASSQGAPVKKRLQPLKHWPMSLANIRLQRLKVCLSGSACKLERRVPPCGAALPIPNEA
jgi:hypothetical protein